MPLQTRPVISPYTAVAGLHFRNTMVRRVDHLSTIGSDLILAYGLSFLWQTLYENGFVPVEIPIGLMVSYAVLGSVLATELQTEPRSRSREARRLWQPAA